MRVTSRLLAGPAFADGPRAAVRVINSVPTIDAGNMQVAVFHDFVFHLPVFHLSTFVVGVGFGIIFVRRYPVFLRQATYWRWLAVSSFILWLGLVITKQPWLLYHHNGLLTPLYLTMLIGLAISKGWLVRLFAAKPLVWLGEISYGVYILQLPVYWLVNLAWMPVWRGISPASMYIYVPVLIIVAGCCHRFIEIPAKLKIRALANRVRLQPGKVWI